MAVEVIRNVVYHPSFGPTTTADAVVIGVGAAGLPVARALQDELGSKGKVFGIDRRKATGGYYEPSLQQGREYQGSIALSRLVRETTDWYKERDLFTQYPYLYLFDNPDKQAVFENQLDALQAAQFAEGAIRMKGPELRKRHKIIDGEAIIGGIEIPEAGRLDFDRAKDIMVRESPNVTFALDTEMERIAVQNGKVVGVETSGGYIATETVILASGPFILQAAGRIPQDVYENLKGKLEVKQRESFSVPISELTADQLVFVVAPGNQYARIKTDAEGFGEALCGYANPEDPVLKPEEITTTPVANDWIFPSIVFNGLGVAMTPFADRVDGRPGRLAVFPDHRTRRAGYYTDTYDGHPIIDRVGDLGITIYEGLSHNGIMLGIAAGRRTAKIALNDVSAEPEFALQRDFAARSGFEL